MIIGFFLTVGTLRVTGYWWGGNWEPRPGWC